MARWRSPGQEDGACEDEKETRTSSKRHEHFASAGGLGYDDPFNKSQLHIVLDFTAALLDGFASRLLDGAFDHETAHPGLSLLTQMLTPLPDTLQ